MHLEDFVENLPARMFKEHDYFNPHQVGVGTPMCAESVVHVTRQYVQDSTNLNKVILKIDFQNAFNSINRGKMLTSIARKFPKIYHFLASSYLAPSLLFFGKNTISSEVGWLPTRRPVRTAVF